MRLRFNFIVASVDRDRQPRVAATVVRCTHQLHQLTRGFLNPRRHQLLRGQVGLRAARATALFVGVEAVCAASLL